MKILMTGSGSSGSWIIRGQQLGEAIRADVIPRAIEVKGYDIAILVKRPPMDLVLSLHRARVPIVWDVVDAWPQPIGNDWTERQCKAWLAERVDIIKPSAIVAATKAMADDCKVFDVPVFWLPHHARPGLGLNPIRKKVSVVGYEGGPQYLGEWRSVLERACAERGWSFQMEPKSITDLDIVVALRDQRGYATRNWKSNVKLVNAQASGTPIICARESGYIETDCGAACWADTEDELLAAMRELTPYHERWRRGTLSRSYSNSIEMAAADYRAWLSTLVKP